MDKRKREDKVTGTLSTAKEEDDGKTPVSVGGLLEDESVSAKKPRLVPPSSPSGTPLTTGTGPKRVILKIKQPGPPSVSATSPAAGMTQLPPSSVVITTLAEPKESLDKEKKRKEAVHAALETAKPGETAVVNDARLQVSSSSSSKFLGAHPLVPHSSDLESLQLFLLPRLTPADHFATLQVRIPAQYLLFSSNLGVRARAVWGTEIYTDDSDIVAATIHSGLYTPLDLPCTIQDMSLSTPIISPKELPDHDLQVTVRVLPRLLNYQGSGRSRLASRSWGSRHDGESIKIESVKRLPRGSVLKLGRKVGVADWLETMKRLKNGRETMASLKTLRLVSSV